MLVISLSLLVGCEGDYRDRTRPVRYLDYAQDTDTNLCFAVSRSGGITALTHVPCTPDVLKIIDVSRTTNR